MEEAIGTTAGLFVEKASTANTYGKIRRSKACVIIATTEIAKLTKEIAELELQRQRLMEWIGREELTQEWRRERVRVRVRAKVAA